MQRSNKAEFDVNFSTQFITTHPFLIKHLLSQ